MYETRRSWPLSSGEREETGMRWVRLGQIYDFVGQSLASY